MSEGKTWYQIVIDNWAQITVIVGVIGFIISKVIEVNIKKREIKYSKLQEKKIIEIKSFYKSYHALELALRDYLYQTEFGAHEKEIFRKIKERIDIIQIKMSNQ